MAIAHKGANKQLPFVQFHDVPIYLILVALDGDGVSIDWLEQERASTGAGSAQHAVEGMLVVDRKARPLFAGLHTAVLDGVSVFNQPLGHCGACQATMVGPH
jgi:hypothetical protein